MKFLLDTNLISEPTKPKPNPGAMSWLAEADEDSVFVSVVSFGEFRYGIERLAAGARRNRLERWLLHDLRTRFAGRILPVSVEVAEASGRLIARSESKGRPLDDRDAFIAATAQVHGLTLVTRNVSDFEPTLESLLNPWT